MENGVIKFHLKSRGFSLLNIVLLVSLATALLYLALTQKEVKYFFPSIAFIVFTLFAVRYGLTTQHLITSEGITELKWDFLKNTLVETAHFRWSDVTSIAIHSIGSNAQFQVTGIFNNAEHVMYLTSVSDKRLEATTYLLKNLPETKVQQQVRDYVERKTRQLARSPVV